MKYLEQEDIVIEPIPQRSYLPFLDKFKQPLLYQLGKVKFRELQKNDGGYVRVDSGGYQLLLNYRGGDSLNFYNISMQDLLSERIPPELVRSVNEPPLKDRIVLIGIINDSDGGHLFTPYDRITKKSPRVDIPGENKVFSTPGVYVHAHITSQLIQGALNGRNFIRVWPKQSEWMWLFIWSLIGAGGRYLILNTKSISNELIAQNAIAFGLVGVGAATLVGFSYSAFLLGWWIPVVPAFCGLAIATLLMGSYHSYELQKLATLDSLTQVANRRYFEEYLYKVWWKCEREKKPISLIMCDIDHFKLFNDFYGHQVGDRCLQQVVASIQQSLRASDLIARYGGEEFIIVLPMTSQEGVFQVAERICQNIEALHIEHVKSPTSSYVTASCGVSSIVANPQLSPVELIASADKGLYLSKAEGRNKATYQTYLNLPPFSLSSD